MAQRAVKVNIRIRKDGDIPLGNRCFNRLEHIVIGEAVSYDASFNLCARRRLRVLLFIEQ